MQQIKNNLQIKRDKFIIPPIQRRILTQYQQFRPCNSESIKRNLIFNSIRDSSITTDHRPARSKSNHKQFLQTKNTQSTQAMTTASKFDSKFKILKQTDAALTWQKWKKPNYNISGKRFFKLVQATIMMKQNSKSEEYKKELFKLRHKIRDLQNMKQNIQKGNKNNKLIQDLQRQSNRKINDFFKKYQNQIKVATEKA